MATAVFTSMQPSPTDTRHDLVVKAAYWAQKYSEDNGFTPGTAIYPDMTPYPNDTFQVALAKLAYWLASLNS